MTKTWDTKNKIIKLLGGRKMTLTDISKELQLAPSTVNQHIKELLDAGAIRQIPNEFYIKLKYYELNPSFSGITRLQVKKKETNLIWRIAPVVIVIAVMAGVLTFLGNQNSYSQLSSQVPTTFSISDAPGSAAISTVNVTVDSATIHSTTTGKWYTIISAPKSFNLVALNNVSAFLGSANLPAGSYDHIALDIQSATAVVNNQSTDVFIPSNMLNVFGNFIIGGNSLSSSWVNIDFNLAKSLHITGDGKVIMLPVLTIKSNANASLGVESNGIITVKAPGKAESELSESMDENGMISASTMPIPPGAAVSVLADGRIVILQPTNSANTIVIRTPDRVIVIANVVDAAGIIGAINAQGNMNTNIGGNGPGFGEGMPMPPGVLCNYEDGSAQCMVSNSLSSNTLPPPLPIIPCKAMMCPRGYGRCGEDCGTSVGIGNQQGGGVGAQGGPPVPTTVIGGGGSEGIRTAIGNIYGH